jgi:hypothetical protein
VEEGRPRPRDLEEVEPLERWDRYVERLIRDAQDEGKFNDLPGHGKPLPKREDAYVGEMAVGFEIMRTYGVAPPWIEADKEIRRLLDARATLLHRARRSPALAHGRYRRQLRDLVEDHNRTVDVLNHEAPTVRQHRRRLVLADEMATLERAFHDGPSRS